MSGWLTTNDQMTLSHLSLFHGSAQFIARFLFDRHCFLLHLSSGGGHKSKRKHHNQHPLYLQVVVAWSEICLIGCWFLLQIWPKWVPFVTATVLDMYGKHVNPFIGSLEWRGFSPVHVVWLVVPVVPVEIWSAVWTAGTPEISPIFCRSHEKL